MRWDRTKLRMPLFGELVAKADVARFGRTLGTLLGNGVTLLHGMAIVRETLSNMAIRQSVDEATERLKQGEGLAEPLAQADVFPVLAIQLIRVGEESGQLDDMLLRVAAIFEQEVQRTTERLLALLVPALTVLLGGLIAGIIASVLLAILSVNQLAF